MLKLYQWEISPFCDKVRRVLHVKKLDYETEELGLLDVISGGLKKINRRAKVPALDHDGRIVVDSSDIARYLDERYPEPRLIPENPKERAQVNVLEDWADEVLYFFEAYLRFAIPSNARRWVPVLAAHDPAAVQQIAKLIVPLEVKRTSHAQGLGRKPLDVVLSELGGHLASLDDWLGEAPWLVGEHLSLADIAVFAQLFCIDGAPEGSTRIDKKPRVREWMERVDAATQPAGRVASTTSPQASAVN